MGRGKKRIQKGGIWNSDGEKEFRSPEFGSNTEFDDAIGIFDAKIWITTLKISLYSNIEIEIYNQILFPGSNDFIQHGFLGKPRKNFLRKLMGLVFSFLLGLKPKRPFC